MSALIFDLNASLPRSLYWDASFLVHATYSAGRHHHTCYAFLERLSQASNTLLPHDALHLSVMARLGIDSIVTTDDDFAPIDGLNLFTGNPRILARR